MICPLVTTDRVVILLQKKNHLQTPTSLLGDLNENLQEKYFYKNPQENLFEYEILFLKKKKTTKILIVTCDVGKL